MHQDLYKDVVTNIQSKYQSNLRKKLVNSPTALSDTCYSTLRLPPFLSDGWSVSYLEQKRALSLNFLQLLHA